MDPISLAIVAAVAAGLAKGAGDVGQSVIVDGYRQLKSLLARRFGGHSQVVQAVDAVESRPESAARRGVLTEEIANSGADRDPEIVDLAQDLLDRIQRDAAPGSSVQMAFGSYIAQADRHGHAEVNVNTPKAT